MNQAVLADEVLRKLRFVLSHTSHPGNIGSAARAIRTMGLRRLSLVSPEQFPHIDAHVLAAGADDVLEAAICTNDLPEAIADCSLVIGATARLRGVALEEWSPRVAAARALDAITAGCEVAFVFGNERSGLSNDEIKLCHAAVHIPSDPSYSSLNLSQAVQVIAYEMRMAVLSDAPARPSNRDIPASSVELEGFFEHLASTLRDIDFHKGRSERTIMQRLRRLFLRASLDQRELRVLRGILADAQRMARLARGD
ncbi:MAG: RNA methyltransferase [Dokdonella sp.]|uniref:RNA methyltransferase n=1 Tax=Dokdonella sp. TaxID=2291710 RepID=UPI002C92D854|nr:RNA methyltransferase [Dokdonella sp.]HOX70420.1 RNA methyltransferase [Dokdonella sp.]HPG95503.1 RNA methyltransferase [Dokdonella sp.]HPN78464.1 RNA methyltransferase [Dokdonella sp.]